MKKVRKYIEDNTSFIVTICIIVATLSILLSNVFLFGIAGSIGKISQTVEYSFGQASIRVETE